MLLSNKNNGNRGLRRSVADLQSVNDSDTPSTDYTAISRKVVGKKRTRQSQKVLWVVLSSLFLDCNISGKSETLARDDMDVCLRELKENSCIHFRFVPICPVI